VVLIPTAYCSDTGSRHDFTIGTAAHPCNVTVLICASGSEYAYELFLEKTRFYQGPHTLSHISKSLS
jgi:hypothetical protein